MSRDGDQRTAPWRGHMQGLEHGCYSSHPDLGCVGTPALLRDHHNPPHAPFAPHSPSAGQGWGVPALTGGCGTAQQRCAERNPLSGMDIPRGSFVLEPWPQNSSGSSTRGEAPNPAGGSSRAQTLATPELPSALCPTRDATNPGTCLLVAWASLTLLSSRQQSSETAPNPLHPKAEGTEGSWPPARGALDAPAPREIPVSCLWNTRQLRCWVFSLPWLEFC